MEEQNIIILSDDVLDTVGLEEPTFPDVKFFDKDNSEIWKDNVKKSSYYKESND